MKKEIINNIARVFITKTNATPDDQLAFVDCPPPWYILQQEIKEIHISATFSWDVPKIDFLEKQWRHIAPVKIGGPAITKNPGDFIPGMYLKAGYTITSRGCKNKCWFCDVWKKNNGIKELEIKEGNNILDDNLLACSDQHIKKVFHMLTKQSKVQFTGGLESKLLKSWHVQELTKIKPAQMFFAYDTPDDLEPLQNAGKILKEAGFNRNQMRCYVLIGYPNDTLEKAESRLIETLKLGFFPMAMRYRHRSIENTDNDQWKTFQRTWSRPASIAIKCKELI